MNKERRTKIEKLKEKIEDIKVELEDIKLDEEISYDSIPDNLKESERAQISENAIDCLDEAISNLEEAISNLEEIEWWQEKNYIQKSSWIK